MTASVRGSVLVVGGGIAGMQASLDLANSGYLVHSWNSLPPSAIDVPAGQDLPTNDCAM